MVSNARGAIMPNPYKVVIAVDTTLREEKLKSLSDLPFIHGSDVTFVHMIQNLEYGDGLAFNVTFRDDVDKSKLVNAVVEKMRQLSTTILPPGHPGKVEFKCLFADDIGEAFCRHLSESKANLAIVASFDQHRVYNISFGDYVSKFAPCHVAVVKTNPSHLNKVVVGLKLDEVEDLTSELSKLEFLKTTDLVLLHISSYKEYEKFSDLSLTPYSVDEEKLVVEQEILKRLNRIRDGLVNHGFSGEVTTVCEFSNHPKKNFNEHVSKTRAGFILIFGSKEKKVRGSFVQYLLHHGNVSVIVLRHGDAGPAERHFHPAYLHRLQGNLNEKR